MSTNVFPHALTNGAWFIGIPDITEENYEKVYMRYEMARFATEAVACLMATATLSAGKLHWKK